MRIAFFMVDGLAPAEEILDEFTKLIGKGTGLLEAESLAGPWTHTGGRTAEAGRPEG